MTVGEKLRQARLEKGLTLVEIQEQTKLPIQNLEALEKDNYDALGSEYNIKTLIYAYAKLLGLNGDALVRQYLTGEDLEAKAEEQYESATRQTRLKQKEKNDKGFIKFMPIIILTIVLLVIVGSIAYAFIKENNRFNAGSDVRETYKVENHADDNKKEEKSKEEVKESVAPAVSSSSKEAEMKIETVSNSGSQAVFKATNVKGNAEFTLKGTNGRCWVSVTANGQTLYQGIVEMGAEQKVSVPAQTKQVSIRTGNAPALDLSLNNQEVDYKGSAGVKQITVTMNLEYLN